MTISKIKDRIIETDKGYFYDTEAGYYIKLSEEIEDVIDAPASDFQEEGERWATVEDLLDEQLDNIPSIQPKTTSTDIEEVKKLLRKTTLEEPYLRQYENRGSAPFYCSLCDMSELDIMDRKSDGRFYCRCSYWSDPHNAYMDKSGGKWLGWYDEDYAQKQAEEKDVITGSYNEAIRDVINLHLSSKPTSTDIEGLRKEFLNKFGHIDAADVRFWAGDYDKLKESGFFDTETALEIWIPFLPHLSNKSELKKEDVREGEE